MPRQSAAPVTKTVGRHLRRLYASVNEQNVRLVWRRLQKPVRIVLVLLSLLTGLVWVAYLLFVDLCARRFGTRARQTKVADIQSKDKSRGRPVNRKQGQTGTAKKREGSGKQAELKSHEEQSFANSKSRCKAGHIRDKKSQERGQSQKPGRTRQRHQQEDFTAWTDDEQTEEDFTQSKTPFLPGQRNRREDFMTCLMTWADKEDQQQHQQQSFTHLETAVLPGQRNQKKDVMTWTEEHEEQNLALQETPVLTGQNTPRETSVTLTEEQQEETSIAWSETSVSAGQTKQQDGSLTWAAPNNEKRSYLQSKTSFTVGQREQHESDVMWTEKQNEKEQSRMQPEPRGGAGQRTQQKDSKMWTKGKPSSPYPSDETDHSSEEITASQMPLPVLDLEDVLLMVCGKEEEEEEEEEEEASLQRDGREDTDPLPGQDVVDLHPDDHPTFPSCRRGDARQEPGRCPGHCPGHRPGACRAFPRVPGGFLFGNDAEEDAPFDRDSQESQKGKGKRRRGKCQRNSSILGQRPLRGRAGLATKEGTDDDVPLPQTGMLVIQRDAVSPSAGKFVTGSDVTEESVPDKFVTEVDVTGLFLSQEGVHKLFIEDDTERGNFDKCVTECHTPEESAEDRFVTEFDVTGESASVLVALFDTKEKSADTFCTKCGPTGESFETFVTKCDITEGSSPVSVTKCDTTEESDGENVVIKCDTTEDIARDTTVTKRDITEKNVDTFLTKRDTTKSSSEERFLIKHDRTGHSFGDTFCAKRDAAKERSDTFVTSCVTPQKSADVTSVTKWDTDESGDEEVRFVRRSELPAKGFSGDEQGTKEMRETGSGIPTLDQKQKEASNIVRCDFQMLIPCQKPDEATDNRKTATGLRLNSKDISKTEESTGVSVMSDKKENAQSQRTTSQQYSPRCARLPEKRTGGSDNVSKNPVNSQTQSSHQYNTIGRRVHNITELRPGVADMSEKQEELLRACISGILWLAYLVYLVQNICGEETQRTVAGTLDKGPYDKSKRRSDTRRAAELQQDDERKRMERQQQQQHQRLVHYKTSNQKGGRKETEDSKK